MIRISVALSKEGVIERLEVAGHSGFAIQGADVVCAAATVLLRTFARNVEAEARFVWDSPPSVEGEFQMTLTEVPREQEKIYEGWCWFLLRGFEDLQRDFPDHVTLAYTESFRRLFHGS